MLPPTSSVYSEQKGKTHERLVKRIRKVAESRTVNESSDSRRLSNSYEHCSPINKRNAKMAAKVEEGACQESSSSCIPTPLYIDLALVN
jgi:hypothetical protein